LLATSAARGEDRGVPSAGPVLGQKRWDVVARGGYGTVFTDGLSYVGPSVGGAVGWRPWGRRLRLEAGVLHAFGSDVRATNGIVAYRSATSSSRVTAGVSVDVYTGRLLLPLILRPGVRAGANVVVDETVVGPARARGTQLYPVVGPSLVLAARLRGFELGVDGEAYYVPTWPAAPLAALSGFIAVMF
jgi:hypothetical protein